MINRLLKSSYRALLSFCGVCASLILLDAMAAQSATYYVATTGNDSNPGTSASPWRNPQKCTHSPIRAGDTCIVRSGTYTDSDGNGMVVWVYDRSSTPSGTASQPITIKSEKPLGAAIIAPSNRNGIGFYVDRAYYVIEGFDISGGNYSGSSGAGAGINFTSRATGGVARSNSIHHIGRSACTNSSNSYSGLIVKGAGVLVDQNRIYSIGRRRNGESGCSTNKSGHDHGIYVAGASNMTVRRNVIYDTNRGYPVHVYGGTTTNLNIYHNTFHSPGVTAHAHILLSSTIKTANIKNNTASDPKYAMIRLYNLSASGVTVSYNLSSKSTRYGSASGVTFSNNTENTNPAFISKSTNDFRLTSSSPVINRGTTSGVPLVQDGRPDASAYEYAEQNNTASPLTPTGLRTS